MIDEGEFNTCDICMCSVEHIYGLKYLFQYVIGKSCREADAFITEKGSVSTRAKV